MCPHADYEGEVQARIDAGYKGTRKVRKDAVRLVEGIVTASPEFFEGASAEEVRDFFEDALGFCREEFGESNLVHFTVHMDEETPHAHFGFVPLRDGKLSWKGFFPDKAALGAMQDRFYGRVGALYGLSRGEKRLEGQPARRHKSVAEYKAESRRVQAELDEKAGEIVADATERAERASAARKRDEARARTARKDLADIAGQVDEKRSQAAEIDRQIAEKMAEIDRLDGEIGEKIDLRNEVGENLQREQRRLESVRQAAGRAEEDVEELEAVASLAERFDRAGRFEKRGILDEIAARCDGLRGRVEQVVDGIRGAVGRAEMAIADLARKLGPRSARMTTRALKRDLAALEKDMSPRAQALEATRAARARDENRDDRPPQRSWGQSR